MNTEQPSATARTIYVNKTLCFRKKTERKMECESMAKEKKKYRKRIQNRQEKPEEGAEKRQK